MDNLKSRIGDALHSFADGTLRDSSVQLLGVLGYRSERVPALHDISDFQELCERSDDLTEKQREVFDDWLHVESVFQLTEDELFTENDFFSEMDFQEGRTESFFFIAVELVNGDYSRGRLSAMTRAVNRLFTMPVILLFRYRRGDGGPFLTVAVVHRRRHKKDDTRDVLERVTLIKDVRARKPHRAHLETLADLALASLTGKREIVSFDELHEAWECALDTEPLNRRFYTELFEWFQRALKEAAFPSAVPKEEQVIRLITRMLFVWFVKEKRLVADDWFVQKPMEQLLHAFGGSDYYRAVLQNLFFATLNTPMDKRGFSTRTRPSHRVFSRYRYRTLIRDVDRFNDLARETPFINGGLFDCLDDEKSRSTGGKRIDMFSDPDPADGPDAAQARRDAWRELNVPDRLFFDGRGLFTLFNHFKFTVEENTPAETEVALDPELLGKVFENLLAAYNPETRDSTAKKATGSYYTPRPVVDYMVDEVLVEAIATCAQPEDGDADFWRSRLHYLLDYEDAGELFDPPDAEAIVRTIAGLKILDPAVGSGAFPMAILHKLTHALRRLDPDNERWHALQRTIARKRADSVFDNDDKRERGEALAQINETFARYSGNFGRKLYLIQNSIFGVDIQPIACQIAKLRFFISLAIEQERDSTADNFGIKPLPNLETRFIATDTLLRQKGQRTLSSDLVRHLERRLEANRERHFHAYSRTVKLQCVNTDDALRAKLADALEDLGLPLDAAHQIARWNAYEQNASADWFDADYMFGVKDGFDVVIGNPPYIQLQKNRGRLAALYKGAGFVVFKATADIYPRLIHERSGSEVT